jgi:hypothetical protein
MLRNPSFVVSLLRASPWKPGSAPLVFGLCRSVFSLLACVVRSLGAGALRLCCFGSHKCARSRDLCGRWSGGSGTLQLGVVSLLACEEVVSARAVHGLGVGLLRLGCFGSRQCARSLGTGVDVGAVAPELFSSECRPFLLGLKWRRLVWCVASGPVCCGWGALVLASARGLGTGVDVGAAPPELFSLECRPFLLAL